MKQTATNYLIEQLELKVMAEHMPWVSKILDTAIEMEKEQIVKARNNGFLASGEGWNGEYGIEDLNLLTQEIKSEEYYNETFKSE